MSKRRNVKHLWLKLFYRRLWVKISAVLLVMITVPLVAMGWLLTRSSEEFFNKNVISDHAEIVKRAAQGMELFLSKPKDVLLTASAMIESVHPYPWKQETVLVELVLNEPMFMRAFSVGNDGRVMAYSEMGEELSLKDGADLVEKVSGGREYVSGLKLMDEHIPYITIAVPLKKIGRICGALVADVSMRGMWDMVDSITLGKTGRAFIVSKSAILLAHPDKKLVLTNVNLKERSDVREALSGRTGVLKFSDSSGRELISSYAPIGGYGWGIVLEQDTDEAYFFSSVMKKQFGVIIFFSELLAILVSIIMARLLLRPLKTISQKMKMVAAGDLNQKIQAGSRDEIGELVRTFNEMTEKLKLSRVQERFSVIGEASARIAHEFKNSLVPIKAFLQQLSVRKNDAVFMAKFDSIVPEELGRMEQMLRKLSSFSSLPELVPVRFDIRALLSDVLEIMNARLKERGISVKFDHGAGAVYIRADNEKIKEVFKNLIINAVEAMPEGGGLSVELRVFNGNKNGSGGIRFVEISVKDTGIGIPEDKLSRVFEPFYSSRKSGMGLGLTLCRRVIEQHGGRIEAESVVGSGTVFTLRLPVGKI